MKKLLYFACSIPLVCLSYSNFDFSNAEYLANEGLIVKQSTKAGYRLDESITRSEVAGLALQLKGAVLPENYQCRKYYSDVIKNDWICRAAEMAADRSLVTRNNKHFRPQDNITRAEALAILIEAASVKKSSLTSLPTISFQDVSEESWQFAIIEIAFQRNIAYVNTCDPDCSFDIDKGAVVGKFHPNRAASRAEIFEFVGNIMALQLNESSNEGVPREDLGYGYEKDALHVYRYGTVLPDIDPLSFEFFESEYLADKGGVYKYSQNSHTLYKIPNLSKKGLRILNVAYIKDSNNAYLCDRFHTDDKNENDVTCKKLDVDVPTFECMGSMYTYSCLDKDYLYSHSAEEKKPKHEGYLEILVQIYSYDDTKQDYSLLSFSIDSTLITLFPTIKGYYTETYFTEDFRKKVQQNLDSEIYTFETMIFPPSGSTSSEPTFAIRKIGNSTIAVFRTRKNTTINNTTFNNWLTVDVITKTSRGYEIYNTMVLMYGYLEQAENILGYKISDTVSDKNTALYKKTLDLFLKDIAKK